MTHPSIVGHGVDLVDVPRIARLLAEHSDRFLSRCFTPAEAAYEHGSARYHEHLAARFAAKEAVLKALGCGLTSGIHWTEIEVVRDDAGAPGVRLTGEAAAVAARRGIGAWHLSLSHTSSLAMASVIATEAPR